MYKLAKKGLIATLFSLLVLSTFTPAMALNLSGGQASGGASGSTQTGSASSVWHAPTTAGNPGSLMGGTAARTVTVVSGGSITGKTSYINTASKYMVKGTIWGVQTLAKKSESTWHAPTTTGNPGSLIGGSASGSGSTGNPAGKYTPPTGSSSYQYANPATKFQVVGSTVSPSGSTSSPSWQVSNPAQKYGTGSTGSSSNPAQKYGTGSSTGSTSSPSWQVSNPAQKYGTGSTSGSSSGSTSGSSGSWQTSNPAQKYNTGSGTYTSSSSSGSSGSWQTNNPAQKYDVPSYNNGSNNTQPVHPGLSKCDGHYYPKDIDGHWSEIYVRRLYDLCVIEGYGDGSFRPDQSITRAELTKMALYAHSITPDQGCYDNDCGTPFIDLDSWQGPWIRPAWLKNIVKGYNGNVFRPNQSITRAESVKVVLATFEYEPYTVDKSFFNDVNGWALGWVEKAHQMGVVQGIGNGNFDPNRPVTRAEAAKIIVKTLEYWDTHIN